MSAEMPEVRWNGCSVDDDLNGAEVAVRIPGQDNLWFVAGGAHIGRTDDDVSEWVNLDVVHRLCTDCGRGVEVDLVSAGCPLCMACLETGGRPAPPHTVAAELQARNMPPDAGVDVLLDLVRREVLAEVHRELAAKAGGTHTGLGSWGLAAAHVQRKLTGDA